MPDTQTPKAELELTDVSKSYGGVHALTGVDLEVHAGSIVAIVGDNGAGKSTLVKIISGTIVPDTGSISVNGQSVRLGSIHDAAEVGIQAVYQDLALCDNLGTVENLFLGRELVDSAMVGRRLRRPTMEKTTRAMLAELDVKIQFLPEPVGRLSGGQRQCIAICRALLNTPRVILLDEPTAALGVQQREQVMNLIVRLRAQGVAVVVISHDLGDVQELADRVVVLRLGRKVAEFTKGLYTREDLLAAITGAAAPTSTHGTDSA